MKGIASTPRNEDIWFQIWRNSWEVLEHSKITVKCGKTLWKAVINTKYNILLIYSERNWRPPTSPSARLAVSIRSWKTDEGLVFGNLKKILETGYGLIVSFSMNIWIYFLVFHSGKNQLISAQYMFSLGRILVLRDISSQTNFLVIRRVRHTAFISFTIPYIMYRLYRISRHGFTWPQDLKTS